MSDLRSSEQQLMDELHQLYREMTDPEEIEKQRIKKERKEIIEDMEKDYGPV